MGSDDLFKKRRAERQKRKIEMKKPLSNSYLIVTEGTRTEPHYFNGLKKLIEEYIGGKLDVVGIPKIELKGEGCSTCKLVEKTTQIVNKSKIMYQNIWVVFDKDDFDDFDQAIKDAENLGYKIGWTNQAFEYWLYLHFYYSDSALHRHDWVKKLDNIFKEYDIGEGEYEKNLKDIYQFVDIYGGVKNAIANAKRRMSDYDSKKCKASEYDPGTTVYLLVEELLKYLEE